MSNNKYVRIKKPADADLQSRFASTFARSFADAGGQDGAKIVRISHDHRVQEGNVLCLQIKGTPSKLQSELLTTHAYSPSL